MLLPLAVDVGRPVREDERVGGRLLDAGGGLLRVRLALDSAAAAPAGSPSSSPVGRNDRAASGSVPNASAKTVASVTLPNIANSISSNTSAMHVFSITTG